MAATDRLSGLRIVDPVLTNLALGYTNAEFIGDVLFPWVPMDKEAGHVPKFGKDAFKLYNTERALRAKSNRVNPEDMDSIDIVLQEHDLEYPIDYREEAEAIFPLQAHGTIVATEGIRLRHEKICADIAQNPANYAASNQIALSGTSCFDNAVSDPIGVVEDGKEAIRQAIGRRPNTMTMGASTYKVLKNHPALLERIKYSQKGVLTVELLQSIFDIPRIVIGEAIMASDAGVFSDIWGDNIVLAFVKQTQQNVAASYFDPSYGYSFRRKGQPLVDTYTEGNKLRLVRSTDIFKPVMVGADAGYFIGNTNG
jgi:hypothetical protein